MIYRFARGDAQAGLRKLKISSVFLRYLFFLVLLFWKIKIFILLFLTYLTWPVIKNYRYVGQKEALFWLPILQITADFNILAGTIEGLTKKNEKK
jgi:hypothetical protein